jgi:Cu(I)/Ag(I) efflux system protein CusF
MKPVFSIFAAALLIALVNMFSAPNTQAQQHHEMMAGDKAEASGKGVLHQIDSEAGTVNLTHDPIPEMGWPEMTMDLPVTRRVDLSGFSEGDPVTFTLKRGRDDVYRIVEMQKSE